MYINNYPVPNNRKQLLHVFDVDGTLTHQDSLLLLLRYMKPHLLQQARLWISVLPVAVRALLTGRPAKLKEALLKQIWKGWSTKKISTACQSFFTQKLQPDLREKALNHIRQLREQNPDTQVVLLSASGDAWLQPLANYLDADLICTQLEYDNQQAFTGRFATPNCKGQEKASRLLKQYPADTYEFVCYADSRSDLPLQTISKQFFYRYF